MRKIIVSMNMTLDGFMAGPNCELDWHFKVWNDEMARTLSEQLSDADTILLGRVTYKAMAGYWSSKMLDMFAPREDIAFADMLNNYQKIVFSRSLATADDWNNTKLVSGSIAEEIAALKQEPGKDIVLYGSGKIVSVLVQQNLVDEYRVWVHPVAIGNGKPLFKNLPGTLNLKLIRTKTFRSGVVLLCYETLNRFSEH